MLLYILVIIIITGHYIFSWERASRGHHNSYWNENSVWDSCPYCTVYLLEFRAVRRIRLEYCRAVELGRVGIVWQ